MAGADFVIPVRNRVRFDDSLLGQMRHVKLISQTGPWLSHIDLAAAAVVVISSRGGVLEEQALLDALQKKRIAGAGFDVYAKEPLPKDHPLRLLPNVVMQPHMGGYIEEGYGWKFIPAVDNIVAFIEGRPQRLAGEKDIARQKQRQATYLT